MSVCVFDSCKTQFWVVLFLTFARHNFECLCCWPLQDTILSVCVFDFCKCVACYKRGTCEPRLLFFTLFLNSSHLRIWHFQIFFCFGLHYCQSHLVMVQVMSWFKILIVLNQARFCRQRQVWKWRWWGEKRMACRLSLVSHHSSLKKIIERKKKVLNKPCVTQKHQMNWDRAGSKRQLVAAEDWK